MKSVFCLVVLALIATVALCAPTQNGSPRPAPPPPSAGGQMDKRQSYPYNTNNRNNMYHDNSQEDWSQEDMMRMNNMRTNNGGYNQAYTQPGYNRNYNGGSAMGGMGSMGYNNGYPYNQQQQQNPGYYQG